MTSHFLMTPLLAMACLVTLPLSARADDSECRADVGCWGEKHHATAEWKCEAPIERLATFAVRWTDKFSERRFSMYDWLDQGNGVVVFIGDKLEAQNANGAWMPITYFCAFNPDTGTVVEVFAKPGRL